MVSRQKQEQGLGANDSVPILAEYQELEENWVKLLPYAFADGRDFRRLGAKVDEVQLERFLTHMLTSILTGNQGSALGYRFVGAT